MLQAGHILNEVGASQLTEVCRIHSSSLKVDENLAGVSTMMLHFLH